MGGDGSSSDDMRRRRFPLVKCKDCPRIVRHYVSETDGNFLRHFYKCTNHGSFKGGCKMWKWEDEYEEYLEELQAKSQFVQAQSVGSSSMHRPYAEREIRGGSCKTRNESNAFQRHLTEIVWLLKVVIALLVLVVCLLVVCVFKQ